MRDGRLNIMRILRRIKFGFFCLLILINFACSRNNNGKLVEIDNNPQQKIGKFTIRETNNGTPKWVLKAEEAIIIESEKIAKLKLPKIDFYEDGKKVSDLESERGRINTDNYDIVGEGKCLMTTVKGERLETENLKYKSDIEKVVTNERVKFIRPGEVINGKGMEASPDLENIVIKNQKVILDE